MKKRKLFIFLIIVGVVVMCWTVFAIIPPSKVLDNNPFIVGEGNRPLIAAHRGGKNLNPENTMLAFDYVVDNYSVDILELDLVMTKDGHLVSIHNETINSSSDVEDVLGAGVPYYVKDFTLQELYEFNFGARFVDREGNKPYANLVNENTENRAQVIRDAKLNITTIDEIFAAYYNSDIMFIIEIKNNEDVGKNAADILYLLLTDNTKYPNSNLIKRVVIGTFHNEIETYLQIKYPDVMRGASVGAAAKFIITQMFGVNIFCQTDFACLQIPTSYVVKGIKIKLDKKNYIKRAHRRNISVQYWTINDEDEMRKLIGYGADVIMTDDPDVLYNVLLDLGYAFE